MTMTLLRHGRRKVGARSEQLDGDDTENCASNGAASAEDGAAENNGSNYVELDAGRGVGWVVVTREVKTRPANPAKPLSVYAINLVRLTFKPENAPQSIV